MIGTQGPGRLLTFSPIVDAASTSEDAFQEGFTIRQKVDFPTKFIKAVTRKKIIKKKIYNFQ